MSEILTALLGTGDLIADTSGGKPLYCHAASPAAASPPTIKAPAAPTVRLVRGGAPPASPVATIAPGGDAQTAS